MTTQLATAAGLNVISVASPRNFDLSKTCGAVDVFYYHDASFVEKVVEAVVKSGLEFVGIFDAVGTPDTYANDLTILGKLGGGYLASVHPPPSNLPDNVTAGMIFGVNDVATPVWRDYVTPALRSGKLKCLPLPSSLARAWSRFKLH
ncbi:hypothetical protein QQX98_000419 [Neonectria punicea]|uniref:Alcohol dehydrogenase-like C-terminal domain-containing protein n=1 Tax=Neonectria punicea TaxID=979145 RepID=A0ABR1HU04_9HYPO